MTYKIVINKVPNSDQFTGLVLKDGKDWFCSSCRGLFFPSQQKAEIFLRDLVDFSHNKTTEHTHPGKVIGKINFKKDDMEYHLEYFLNNNFRMAPVVPEGANATEMLKKSEYRLLYSYYSNIPPLPDEVVKQLDEFAQSTVVNMFEIDYSKL